MRYASVTKGQKMKVPSSMYSTSGKGWVGEPELQAEIRTANRTVNITGTLRASKCTRFTSNKTAFTDNMCVKCTAVERTNSFQYALGSRNAQEPSYIDGYDQKSKNGDLARDQLEHKADTMAKKLHMAEVEVTRLRQVIANKHDDQEELQEADEVDALLRMARDLEKQSTGTGSPQETAAMLLTAQAGGKFGTNAESIPKNDTLLGVFSDSMYNLDRHAKGHRYSDSTKYLFAAIAVRYGPGAAEFVALNVGGPMRTTVKKVIPKIKCCIGMAGVETMVKDSVEMYKTIMKQKGIKPGSVHVKLAEDETATLSELHWNEANDTLEGSCGLKTEHIGVKHRCRDDCVIPIRAGGTKGYQAIVDAFSAYQIGDYGRLIMYNPCHEDLPALVILVVPTCNRFDSKYVDRQWKSVMRICNTYLGHIVGTACGSDSDGDGRRRSLQQAAMLSDSGTRYYPKNCPGFTYTARLTTVREERLLPFGEHEDHDGGEDGGEDEDYKVGESELCPEGHPLALTQLQTDANYNYTCDECSGSFGEGTAIHSCQICDYDVCQACVPQISGKYERDQDEADASYDKYNAPIALHKHPNGHSDSDEDMLDAKGAEDGVKEMASTARSTRAQRRGLPTADAGAPSTADAGAPPTAGTGASSTAATSEESGLAATSMFADGVYEVTSAQKILVEDSICTWHDCKCKEEHRQKNHIGVHPRCDTCKVNLVRRVINGTNVILDVKNLLCLAEGAWLDDDCLAMYRAHLRFRNQRANGGNHTVHFCSPFFFTTLVTKRGDSEVYDFSGVSRWTKNVDIFAMAHVVVPVNVRGQHWVPVVIDMEAQTITYMDSYAQTEAGVPAVAKTIMDHLLQYLKDEYAAVHEDLLLPAAWDREGAMRGGTIGTCEQQANTHDCGVFTAMVMHSLAVQGNVKGYLAADAPNMRLRMFTDFDRLAKGAMLDGVEGEVVETWRWGEELGAMPDGEECEDAGSENGAAGSATAGRGTRRRCSLSRRPPDEWLEDGAHDEDEDVDEHFPRLAPDTIMVDGSRPP